MYLKTTELNPAGCSKHSALNPENLLTQPALPVGAWDRTSFQRRNSNVTCWKAGHGIGKHFLEATWLMVDRVQQHFTGESMRLSSCGGLRNEIEQFVGELQQ